MTVLLSCISEYQVHQVHSWYLRGPEKGAGLSLKHCLESCFLCPLWTPSSPVVRTSLLFCKKEVRLLALRLPSACFHLHFFLL